MTALAVPLICSPLKDQAVQFAQQSYSHLADLELADHPTEDCDSEVDVLIGNDFYWSFFTGDMKRGESGPVAMKTSLGCVLSGPMPHAPGSGSDVNLVTCHTLRLNTSSCDDLNISRKDEDPLVEQVKKFWELESIGVSPHEGTVHDKFLDTIRWCDGRYEVSLPWKEQHALLPDNYALPVSRLASVLKRLRRNPELLAEYSRIIDKQSSQEIISDVDPNAPVQVGTYEELLTVVVEIECVLNSRPLTYVSSEDRVEPLTSSHLLTGRRLLSIPDESIVAEEESSEVEIITRKQRYVTSLLSHFWSRWKRVYVVELREHHRVLQKGAVSNSPSVEIGDIVTVMEEGKSNRGIWKLGKVLEVCPGNDGLVRGATIEVASSNGKRKRLRRPLQKLFPLEVRETSVADGEEPARPIAYTSERPRRQAAIEGEMRRRQVDQCLDEQKDYDEH